MISIKSKEEIETMSQAGKILSSAMKELVKMVRPGVSASELDKSAEDFILKSGAKPAFKGYDNFPAALCVSINEELVHGIPSDKQLEEGDIVSLDLGVEYKGYNSDMAVTLPVGKISKEAQKLVDATKKSLDRGISKIKPGNTFGDVGHAVQEFLESQGFGVVRELCGHGIGKELHEDPQVLNYGNKGSGAEIKEGMVFCVEPMATAGDWRIKKAKDNYGFQTKDGSLSAHFEHTIAVTRHGCRILTE